jgi:hypothetical protein
VVGVTPRTSDASLTDISLRVCRSPSPGSHGGCAGSRYA